MHFTHLALANSYLLSYTDLTICDTPKRNITQFSEICLEVARIFFSQNDNSDFSEWEKASSEGYAPCLSSEEG